MKTPMSPSYTIKEIVYKPAPLRAAFRRVNTALILNLLLVTICALCDFLLVRTLPYIDWISRSIFAITSCFIFLPGFLKADRAKDQLRRGTQLVCMGFSAESLLSLFLKNLAPITPWWVIPAISLVLMVPTAYIVWRVVLSKVRTTCEIWDDEGLRYLYIEQIFAFFPDREVFARDRICYDLRDIQSINLSEDGMRLEIRGNGQFPVYAEGEDDLKALAFDETNPTSPVKMFISARSAAEKETLTMLYEAIQDRMIDCP